ncbi:MAG TPA: hypothetical protein PKY05_14490, partial [Fibrobacteria bacterium]|nr:hypothetical protein [Fibrobacteria bacterium]
MRPKTLGPFLTLLAIGCGLAAVATEGRVVAVGSRDIVQAKLQAQRDPVRAAQVRKHRWFCDSLVMGEWVDTAQRTVRKLVKKRRKEALTWIHLGPTADCPHMIPTPVDFSCMDHWIRRSYDDEPHYGLRWDPEGLGATILTYRWVVFYDERSKTGSDSVEGPTPVGRIQLRVSGQDTALEVVFRGQRSWMVRGARPDDYEGRMEPVSDSVDRDWFTRMHRADLEPLELVIPEPVRCLLRAHQTRTDASKAKTDTSCLATVASVADSGVRNWLDPDMRWSVTRHVDSSGTGLQDAVRFRLPDSWPWVWWERRQEAMIKSLAFVTGQPLQHS